MPSDSVVVDCWWWRELWSYLVLFGVVGIDIVGRLFVALYSYLETNWFDAAIK